MIYAFKCVVGYIKNFGQLYIIIALALALMAKSCAYNDLENDFSTCNSTLDTQNSAIEDLQIKTLEHKKEAQEAAKKADILRSDYDKRIVAIQKEQVPNECIAAMKWGIEKSSEL